MARTKQTARKVWGRPAFMQHNPVHQPFGGYGGGMGYSNQVDSEEETKMEEENKEELESVKIATLASQDKLRLIKDPLNAFHLFKMDNFDRTRRNNPLLTLMEVIDILAQEWENSDDFTKDKYQKIYDDIQDRKANPEKFEKKKEIHVQSAINLGSAIKNNSQDKPTPPKRPLTAFFLFKNDVYDELKKENPEAKITELTKMISQRWMNLDQDIKKAYEKKHEEAKEKYAQELKEYESKSNGTEKKNEIPQSNLQPTFLSFSTNLGSAVKGKSLDKPAPPKRPLTAFFYFKDDQFAQIRKENPDAKVTELVKIICEKWKNIDQESRAAYEKRQEAAKEKYSQDMKEYEATYGPIETKKRRMKVVPEDSEGSDDD